MTPRERGAAKRQIAKVQDYQSVFNSPQGKRVLYDMMAAHFIIQPLPKDPNDRDRAEGERNVILRILSKMKVDTTKMKTLIQEADDHVSRENSL